MFLKEAMYYETIKLVTVKNWKLGLINRIIQLLVLVYIGVYAIWFNRVRTDAAEKQTRIQAKLDFLT